MTLTNKLSFIIPVRVDCPARMDNLRTVLYILETTGCRIFIIEADSEPRLQNMEWMRDIEYEFIGDTNPLFRRTMYINKLLSKVETEMVGVWDADVLVKTEQIAETIQLIERGCTISYPYNGEFVMLDENMSKRIRKNTDLDWLDRHNLPTFRGRRSCGGAFIVDRKRYLICGAENEHYKGWGLEDEERRHRVEIMGYETKWISTGKLYHLYHPIGNNSQFWSEETALQMRQEFVKECCFDKNEMEYYIRKNN